MCKLFLQIDVSNIKDQADENFIKIRFQNDDAFQVKFSTLINKSKYIRNKYKYSEALDSIQEEIEEIEDKFNISEESIKDFFHLIQDEKVNIPIERYRDIYTLSEYFCITKFTTVLDKISRKELLKDLNFTIQFLIDSQKVNDHMETKVTSKIESFLKEQINECIKNDKFRELPISTLYRIIDISKEKVDNNLLVDFILKSDSSHFILLKFVELQKLTEKKIEELINFFDNQEEDSKKNMHGMHTFQHIFHKNDQI